MRVCEAVSDIELNINRECTRRAALMQLVALCGCEIEYEGRMINLRTHRGCTEYREAMDGKNVTDLSVNIDSRSGTSSYGITLYKKLNIGVGDNVHIVFSPFRLDVYTRIISLSYNPFNRWEISIDVGDYVPSISDNLYSLTQAANDAQANIDASTADIKTGVNTEEITIGSISTEMYRLAYDAYKDTWAAFTATSKFVLTTGGTVVFILKKDENEVMRYAEAYTEGAYARTYSYPFVSAAGRNTITFSVLTTDGAVGTLPELQSWGYVMGAYLVGDFPWDGYIRFREVFTEFTSYAKGDKYLCGISDTATAALPERCGCAISETLAEFTKDSFGENYLESGLAISMPTAWNPIISSPPPLAAGNTSDLDVYIEMRNPVKLRTAGEITAAAFTMIVTVGTETISVSPTSAQLDSLSVLEDNEIGSILFLTFDASIMSGSTQSITLLYDAAVGNLYDAISGAAVDSFQTTFIYEKYEGGDNDGT